MTNIHVFLDLKDQDQFQEKLKVFYQFLNSAKIQVIPHNSKEYKETEHVSIINEYRFQKFKNQFSWIADSDEFIHSPQELIKSVNFDSCNCILGIVVDRFSMTGSLDKINLSDDIFKKFPLCGFFSKISLNANIKKVAFIKGEIPYLKVFHEVKQESQLIPSLAQANYYHFKWTSQLIINEQLKRRDPYFDNKYYQKEMNFMYEEMIKNGFVDLSEIDLWYQG
jgi:hypothetical protein